MNNRNGIRGNLAPIPAGIANDIRALLYTQATMPIKFDAADVLGVLNAASTEVLDAAPFGIIQMGGDGAVTSYNEYESRLSGLSPEKVRGRHFFHEIAQCTNNFMVAQKYEDQAELDQIIDYVFTFRMRPTNVRLRLLKSAASPNRYLLVLRTA